MARHACLRVARPTALPPACVHPSSVNRAVRAATRRPPGLKGARHRPPRHVRSDRSAPRRLWREDVDARIRPASHPATGSLGACDNPTWSPITPRGTGSRQLGRSPQRASPTGVLDRAFQAPSVRTAALAETGGCPSRPSCRCHSRRILSTAPRDDRRRRYDRRPCDAAPAWHNDARSAREPPWKFGWRNAPVWRWNPSAPLLEEGTRPRHAKVLRLRPDRELKPPSLGARPCRGQ